MFSILIHRKALKEIDACSERKRHMIKEVSLGVQEGIKTVRS